MQCDFHIMKGEMNARLPRLAQTHQNAPSADTMALQHQAQEAAALLKALGNPSRLLLLCSLVAEEVSVTELGTRTGIAQPSLSQQLGILRAERLVDARREGKSIFYRIADPSVLAVLRTLQEIFCPSPEPARRRRKS